MDKQIEEKVIKMICEIIGCEEKDIHDKGILLEDLGYDSITKIQLQVEIEDEFGFLFDPLEDDFDDIFSTVEKLCQYVVVRVNTNE